MDVYYVYPTQVSDVIAGLVERPGVELKADNGKDDVRLYINVIL